MIVYLITNLINNKQYVGQSIYDDHEYFGSGILINQALIKYGRENFIKETLIECENRKQLNNKEIYFIKNLNTLHPNGYNLTNGGQPRLGPVHPSVAKKISETQLKKNPKSYHNKEWLKNKYIDEDLSTAQIALICKVDQTTILKWLKKLNIEVRFMQSYDRHKPDCQCCICKAARRDPDAMAQLASINKLPKTKKQIEASRRNGKLSKDRIPSEATCRKISESHKGKTLAPDHNRKLQEGKLKSFKENGHPQGFLNHIHKKSSKQQIRETTKRTKYRKKVMMSITHA